MTTWTRVAQELHYVGTGPQWLRWTGSAWSATNGAPFEPAGVQENDLCVVIGYVMSTTAVTAISGWTQHDSFAGAGSSIGNVPGQMLASVVRGASAVNMAWPTSLPIGTRLQFLWYRADAGAIAPTFESVEVQNHTSPVTDIVLTAGITTTNADELLFATAGQGVGVAPSNAIATDPGTGSGSSTDNTTHPTAGTWINRRVEVAGNLGWLIADAVKATAGATGAVHITGGQSRTSRIIVARFSAAAAADTTPPTFSVAPAVTGIGATGATFSATINETGRIDYVVVPQGDTTPTPTEVRAGQASGGGAPTDSGSVTGATSISDAITGLTASTAYKAVCIAEDDESTPNVQAAVTVVNFSTTAVDSTPPTFSVAPAVSSITQTGGTATATINETGDIYYVVVAQGDTTPSVSEVIAGQESGGGAPLDSGSALAGTSLSDAFTGLTANTAYKAVFVARDDEGTPNVQAAVTVVNFTTAAVSTASITIGTGGVVNGADSPLPAQTIRLIVCNPSDGSVVVNTTVAYTTAPIVLTHASLVAATQYIVFPIGAGGIPGQGVLVTAA